MILGRRLLNITSNIKKLNVNQSKIQNIGCVSQNINLYSFSNINKNNSSDDINMIDANADNNHESQLEKVGLKYNKQKSYDNKIINKSNQKNNGILPIFEQKQLHQLNMILQPLNQDKEQQSDDEEENQQQNEKLLSEINKQVMFFMGESNYDSKNMDQFIQFLNMCTADRLKQAPFYQVCALILSIGRNSLRKKVHFIYKKSLNQLVSSFNEKNPINKIIDHINKNNGVFKNSDFSFHEFEYLRNTLPQIIVALQNCGYYDDKVFRQYYQILSSKGFLQTSIYVKTLTALMWAYLKFDVTGIDYQIFLNHIFERQKYIYYQSALRLLYVCTTHSGVTSPEQFKQIQTLFIQKLDQQNILIFNNKNSSQILQIIYKLYPNNVQDIYQSNQRVIQELCQNDKFFERLLPLIKLSQKVMRYKYSNKDNYKIIIFNQKAQTQNEYLKKQIIFASKFEMNVHSVLKSMNPSLKIKQNVFVGDAYEVDFLIEDHNIAFEINGSSHYFYDKESNSNKLFVNSSIKLEQIFIFSTINTNYINYYFLFQRILKLFGIKHVININQFDWYRLKQVSQMQDYILTKLKEQNIDTNIFQEPNQSLKSQNINKVQFYSENLEGIN